MKLVQRKNCKDPTFDWIHENKTVASVTLYGRPGCSLVEFSGNYQDIAIESVGFKDQVVCIDNLMIRPI
jgi:hypothetical protein